MENKKWSSLPDLNKVLLRMEDIIGRRKLEDILRSFVIDFNEHYISDSSGRLMFGDESFGSKYNSYGILNDLVMYISKEDDDLTELEYKLLNLPIYSDAAGNIIQEDDDVYLFNNKQHSRKWSSEKVCLHNGHLHAVFHKYLGPVYSKLDDIDKNNLILKTVRGPNVDIDMFF